VYLYELGGPLNLIFGWLCLLAGFVVVQELCEWFPGSPKCSTFTKWFYGRPMFKIATGALVISKLIERRASAGSATVKSKVLIYRLPCVVDAARFATKDTSEHSDSGIPNFLWCGTWFNDVLFLIRVFALVRQTGHQCRLTIVGPWPDRDRSTILTYAAQRGLSADDLVLAGCIDDHALEASYRTATALLLPLWDDDTSRTRLPNKLGEYLASGRPVIAGEVGDLVDLLSDNINAYLCKAGDERAFADQMITILNDPEQAARIGAAGQQVCFSQLDYKVHVTGLAKFFRDCIEQGRRS
jgi:glycosyltransferase involved in cell wall biosynthesis